MMSTQSADLAFREGDAVVLAEGTYQGTSGVFLRLREDASCAHIAQQDGVTRSHPVSWLAHCAGAPRISAN